MAKSAPSPTNSTANATEIGFNAPPNDNPPPRRYGKADRQGDRDRQNEPRPAQCQPQDQQDDDGADKTVGGGPLPQRGELRVRDGNRAGQSHIGAEVLCKLGARGGVADGGRGLRAGLQCTVVKLCPNVDETAELVCSGRLSVPKSLPGELGQLAGQDILERLGDL